MSKRLRQSDFLAKKNLLAAVLEEVTAGDKGQLWQVQKQGIPLKVFRGSLWETPMFPHFCSEIETTVSCVWKERA